MAERLIVVDKARLGYSGPFDAKEVFEVIRSWASDKGYWIYEKKHTETVAPEGKFMEFDLEPFKKITDYSKGVVKIRIQMSGVKDITLKRDNKKVKLQEGNVSFVFTGILETDYEHKWESKPVFYVLRTVVEKYMLRPFISGHEKGIKEDVDVLLNQLRSYLNLSKFL